MKIQLDRCASRDAECEREQLKYSGFHGQGLTDVSVAQRLVQGQDATVGWQGSDPAFFCLRRIVAGGRDGDLVSDLQNQEQKKKKKNKV